MLLDQCIVGDCRDAMLDLIARDVKVQTVVTSPPYWGLRDYGVPGQIGLEQSPARYLARMRSVFRLVWDLLADDGTLWLNMGDCYATGAGKVGEHPGGGVQGARWRGDINRTRDQKRGYRGGRLPNQSHMGKHAYGIVDAAGERPAMGPRTQPNRMPIRGLKPKDMVGMPWMLALTLRADGWYLRSDIIWSKPNPMPESVTDRPTKAHEYLFLLAKSERYYYDSESIREARATNDDAKPVAGFARGPGSHTAIDHARDKGDRKMFRGGGKYTGNAAFSPDGRPNQQNGNREPARDTRNRRTVWEVATEPFPGAHFATFPEKLIEPCILAGSRPGDVVFDPFMGAGTVAAVATRLGRRWLGCELNPEYVELQKPRAAQQGMPL